MSCNLIQIATAVRGAYGGTDPYFNSVVALLHLDSQNADGSFEDKKGHLFKPYSAGGVNLVADPLASGGLAAQFDGTVASEINGPNYLEEFRLHGDFTMEAFVTQTVRASVAPIIGMGVTFGNTGMILYINASGKLVASSGSAQYINSPDIVPLNVRTHVALTRKDGLMALWINGHQSGTVNSNVDFTDGVFSIGGAEPTQYRFIGTIDEVRVTNGVARYTVDFTPSTNPWPDQ